MERRELGEYFPHIYFLACPAKVVIVGVAICRRRVLETWQKDKLASLYFDHF